MASQTFTSSQTWVVPDGVTLISKVTVIGGGGCSGYNLYRIDAAPGQPSEGHGGKGEAGSITVVTNIAVFRGQQIQVIIGNGSTAGTLYGFMGQGVRYSENNPGGTSSFGGFASAAGGRGGGNGANSTGVTDQSGGEQGRDGLSFNPSNGTAYGKGGVPPDSNFKSSSGEAGAVIIEYGQGPVTPPPTGGDVGDFPDLNGDPRFILSRIRQIVNIIDKLCAELWGIGKIFYNPVIVIPSTGRPPHAAIPDSMKSPRIAWEAWATNMVQAVNGSFSAEQPLTVNGMNHLIGIFNLVDTNAKGSSLPDIGGTIGNGMVDLVRPEEIATWRWLSQMRAKYALYRSYIQAHDSWFSGNLCARSCQVSCQTACQNACQGCNNSTCHNQNCGGFS